MSRRRRLAYLTAAVALPAVAMSVASIDQMGRIGNAYADELAGNGLFTFSAAMRRNELDYDRFYATIPQEDADRILESLGVDRRPLQPPTPNPCGLPITKRPSRTRPQMPAKPRHVVLIMVESLSAEFVGAYGSTKGLTPNLDRFAREGLKFTNAYATGTRTVRGLEAVSVGTPPVPGQSIVRRPDNAHLTTVGGVLERQGYATSFVYGGYGYFDNMNAYFAGNDYRVIDRVDFPKSTIVFENVWGVADESLFANVLRVHRRQRGARQAVVHARHDDFEPPAVHLPRRPDRHPLAGRARRWRQVHGLGDRQVHRRCAIETVVRRDAVRDRRRPLRLGRRQDQAAGARAIGFR